MTITIRVFHGRACLCIYEARFLPPIGHILTVDNSDYQVISSQSVIKDDGRRSSTPEEVDFSIRVIPHIKVS